MHPVDIIIVISIACMVGFIPLIYVKHDLFLAIGYLVASTIGAFTGSHIALWYFSQSSKPGIIFGGIVGALLPVVVWHFIRRGHDK